MNLNAARPEADMLTNEVIVYSLMLVALRRICRLPSALSVRQQMFAPCFFVMFFKKLLINESPDLFFFSGLLLAWLLFLSGLIYMHSVLHLWLVSDIGIFPFLCI